ncbi:MAG: lysophospholipase [Brevefilum sp.]|nr:lysophospholipase [Brevefilum sp.]
MNPTSFTFTSKDGLSLFGRAWISPSSQPKGTVHLVHGLGEHSGRYDHIGKALAKAGYHLASFDLRGHGLSEGPRGHTPGLSYLMDDIRLFLDESSKHLGNSLPKFIYGHSLGGILVLNFGLQKNSEFLGAIVTSPWIKTTEPPPSVKVALAKFMANVAPGFTLKTGLKTDALSRNATVVKAYRDDVYNHDYITARMGLDILESGRMALEKANTWEKPLLLIHGAADQITSSIASKEFAEKAGDPVEFVLWNEGYHELHNDFGSEQVISKMIHWLDKKVN